MARPNRTVFEGITETKDFVDMTAAAGVAEPLVFSALPATLSSHEALSGLVTKTRFDAPKSTYYKISLTVTFSEKTQQDLLVGETSKKIYQGYYIGYTKNTSVTPSIPSGLERFGRGFFGLDAESKWNIVTPGTQTLQVVLDVTTFLETGDFLEFYLSRDIVWNGGSYTSDSKYRIDVLSIQEINFRGVE